RNRKFAHQRTPPNTCPRLDCMPFTAHNPVILASIFSSLSLYYYSISIKFELNFSFCLYLQKIKIKKTILLLTAFTGAVSAQTTITKAFHDPIIGETVNYITVNGTVDNSATGSGATFSNGSLTQGGATVTTYTAPTASEITTFPGSTIKMIG